MAWLVPFKKISSHPAWRMARMVKKHPRIIHKELIDLQASKRTVTPQAVSNIVHQHGLWPCRSQKVLLLKKSHVDICLKLRSILYKPDTYWNNSLWSDKIKMEVFSLNSYHQVWRKNEEFQLEDIVPTVKHRDSNLMAIGLFFITWYRTMSFDQRKKKGKYEQESVKAFKIECN